MWRAVLPRPPLCGGEMFAVIATECDVKVSDPLQTDRAPIVNLCIQKKVSANRARGPDQDLLPQTFGHLFLQTFGRGVLAMAEHGGSLWTSASARVFGHLPPQVFGSLYTPPGTARADWASNHSIHFVHRVSPTLEGRRREMQLSLSRVSTVGPSLAVLCVEPDCIMFIVSAVFNRCGGILQGVSVLRHCGHNRLAAPRSGRFC